MTKSDTCMLAGVLVALLSVGILELTSATTVAMVLTVFSAILLGTGSGLLYRERRELRANLQKEECLTRQLFSTNEAHQLNYSSLKDENRRLEREVYRLNAYVRGLREQIDNMSMCSRDEAYASVGISVHGDVDLQTSGSLVLKGCTLISDRPDRHGDTYPPDVLLEALRKFKESGPCVLDKMLEDAVECDGSSVTVKLSWKEQL